MKNQNQQTDFISAELARISHSIIEFLGSGGTDKQVRQLKRLLAEAISPELRTERRSAQRELDRDELTGVANRRAWTRARTRAELDPATAIILFDANNFGQINKRHGHEAGDHELKAMATSIKQAAAAFGLGSRVFRVGGDEFVVIAPKLVARSLIGVAQRTFGVRPYHNVLVSITGSAAGTLVEADRKLQPAKARAKERAIQAQAKG